MCCRSLWKKGIAFVLAFMFSVCAVNFANEVGLDVSQTTRSPEKVSYPNGESGSGCGECYLPQSDEQNCFACKDGKFKPYVEFKSTKKLNSEMGKAQFISKPIAQYTNEARQNQIQGTVRLRVTLSADREVKNIVPINSLPFGLTEQAAAAANQIKFRPAFKDGKAISQIVVLEYNFTIY